jgi:hypothetical protein
MVNILQLALADDLGIDPGSSARQAGGLTIGPSYPYGGLMQASYSQAFVVKEVAFLE